MKPVATILLAALAIFVTGCRAEIGPTVKIEETQITMTMKLELQGPAAKVFEDPELKKELADVIYKRFGDDIKTSEGTETLTFEKTFTEPKPAKGATTTIGGRTLKDAGPVTGIAEISYEETEDKQGKIKIVIEDPTELKKALKEVDDEDAYRTMLETMEIAAVVEFPGNITKAAGPGNISYKENVATIKQPIGLVVPGTIEIEGALSDDSNQLLWAGLAFVFAILLWYILVGNKKLKERKHAKRTQR